MKDNCKNTMIFGSSHDYIGREICRQMRLIKLPSRAMLIRQGDTGDRCYILIDGLVDVYCKDDSHILTCDETTTDLQYNVVKVTTDYGEYKATLGPGAVVGDVVLLNPSARRNATVIVSKRTTECCLVYLGRVDYVRLIRTVSMETSHYVQAEVLDYMYLFQKWPTADRMKLVAQMRSTTFRANDYLYRAGTIATTMFVLVSGEAMERQNFNLLESSRPLASKHNAAEVKINIELMLLGPGEIANEHAFLKANQVGAFDIKAVTDVHALCISRHMFECMTVSDKDFVQDMYLKLVALAADRDDYRRERLEFGSRYPDAHVAMTWHLMRMGNLRCARCGRRGHVANEVARCHHDRKYDWAPLQLRIEKQVGQTQAVLQKMTRAASAVVAFEQLSHPVSRRSPPLHLDHLLQENDALLPSAKDQLAECWRQRLRVYPCKTLSSMQNRTMLATEGTRDSDRDDRGRGVGCKNPI
ncbi:hypothetical protein, variant 2 [Aphanomyces invadans]|nr:hypothetical protein, variant 2 [Aphanomyces invadans]ETW08115.1 hypothetical protein, variant 2 [Aphanomyces invadans]|eukprot:XP_008864221.1 hypothetical protein, variant 2 [Aphanomyces invadans]